jgi:adenosylmethionine-8-amino-7-oxononanoate aminotransferase
MYRLGPSSTSSLLQVTPDIAIFSSILGGGYLPITAILTTAETFNAACHFNDDESGDIMKEVDFKEQKYVKNE